MTARMQVDVEGNLWLGLGDRGIEVSVACFSVDGARVLMATRSDTALVFATRGGRRLGTIRVTSPLAGTKPSPESAAIVPFIESADLSPDGTLALLGLNDGTAGIYSVSEGVRTAVLHEPHVPSASRWSIVRAVAFSPDGALAAVGFADRSAGLYAVPDGRPVRFLQHPQGSRTHTAAGWQRERLVCTLKFSAAGDRLFAGTADLEAAVWDVATGELVADHWEHRPEILDIATAGPRTVWATSAGEVFESVSDSDPRPLARTGAGWTRARFAPDGSSLVVQSHDGAVERRACTGERLIALREHPWDHLPSPDGAAVAMIVRRPFPAPAEVQIWSLSDGHLIEVFAEGRDADGIAWSPDGRVVAIARGARAGSTIVLRDVIAHRTIATIDSPDERVGAVAFAPDGRWLATLAHGRLPAIRAWTVTAAPEPIATFGHDRATGSWRAIHSLAGDRLLIVNDTGFEVWRFPDTRLHRVDHGFAADRAWSVSGDRYFVSLGQNRIASWNLVTGAPGAVLARRALRPEAFPDPSAAPSLWRMEWGPVVHVSNGPRGWSVRPGLSADGRLALVPGAGAASLVTLTSPPRIVASMRFEGTLRASCVTADRFLAVNAQGELFQGQH